MATGHLIARNYPDIESAGSSLGPPRRVLDVRCTPAGMDTYATSATEPSMTLPELAAFLSVSNQALYDLRSKGRGPRGFRVGRLLRFRLSEVEAWIAGMEAADGERHPRQGAT